MALSIKLYNTLSGEKESLAKIRTRPLRLFVCGPTVYDDIHIGNARTFVIFDMLVRFLRSQGIEVRYLQNITDIDDKIIGRAKKEGVMWKLIAKKYEKAYLAVMRELGVKAVDHYARATDYISQIVLQVRRLIAKKNAYLIEGDGYYFDVMSFAEYGKLARRTAAQADDGVSRIDNSSKKRHTADFCLWKFSGGNEPGWKTELGYGRPGWHIEDTAITEHFFGLRYELHGGGIDLKFPHHEAEIAQAESLSGKKPFVKIWLHAGALTAEGQKMSKSLGNFITTKEYLSKFPASTFRMMILAHHYRSPLDFSKKAASDAEDNVSKITKILAKLIKIGARNNSRKNHGAQNGTEGRIEEMQKEVTLALADDFNSPKALAALFEFIAFIQPNVWKMSESEAGAAHNAIGSFLKLFGVAIKFPTVPPQIIELVKERERTRRKEQYVLADRIRKQLLTLGYTVEDTPQGPFVWPEASF